MKLGRVKGRGLEIGFGHGHLMGDGQSEPTHSPDGGLQHQGHIWDVTDFHPMFMKDEERKNMCIKT